MTTGSRGCPGYTRRDISLTTLGEARWSRTPIFVKQPREKSLPAAVYADGSRLPTDERHPPCTSPAGTPPTVGSTRRRCGRPTPRRRPRLRRAAGPRHRLAARDRPFT
ncbi:hypothetical protein ACFQX7_32290 [Luedemannella flava]